MPQAIVAGIAVRTARGGVMLLLEEANAKPNGGLAEDIRVTQQRGVTLISRSSWKDAIDELGVELPWHTRRANVLVDDLPLAELIGQQVRLGQVVLQIHAETEPCQMMDRQYPGLRKALEPNCRAGVYGQVLVGGRVRIGDSVQTHTDAAVSP